VELDGFEYHKTREQQTIDSIKRNNASALGISLLTYTSKRINEDINAVFREIDIFLK
jgi:very-short-patch-repair endonuclease